MFPYSHPLTPPFRCRGVTRSSEGPQVPSYLSIEQSMELEAPSGQEEDRLLA